MRRFLVSNTILVSFAMSVTTSILGAGETVDLFKAYASAVQKTETVPIQRNISDQSRETVEQAYSTMRPAVDFTYSYLRQDVPDTISGASGAVASSIAPRETRNSKITITQPVFQGGKEYPALRIAKEGVVNSTLLEEQTHITLFQNVAEAFFSVLAAEQDRVDLDTSLKIHQERFHQLNEWFKIGRTRKGDLLLEKSAIASLKAQIDSDQYTISQARFQLAFLTGLDEKVPLDKSLAPPTKLAPLNTFLETIDQRPDIKALRSQLKMAEDNIAVARGGHYPTVALFGDGYFVRTGALKNSKWDVGINLTVPIYQGGGVSSQVRQASLKQGQLQLQLDQALRNTQNTIKVLHDGVASGQLQIASYREAVKAAEDNYHEQVRDFRNGLVTNLDVIQALSTLQDTKRAADRSLNQTLTQYAQLRSSSGVVPTSLSDD